MEMWAGWLRWASQLLALGAEALGAVVVAISLVRALVHLALDFVRRTQPFPRERIRLSVGRSLALALEFLLAADILRTAVEPTWDEIARLAAIAAIRTALNFFLQREIAREEERTGISMDPGRPAHAKPPRRPPGEQPPATH